jgi:hypothetical protein
MSSTGHQGMHGHEFLEFEYSHGMSALLMGKIGGHDGYILINRSNPLCKQLELPK